MSETTALDRAAELRAQMAETYHALCDQRDAAYAKAAPVQAELDKAITATQACQATELALAKQIEDIWGPDHFALKKEIGRLAAALGKIPPRK